MELKLRRHHEPVYDSRTQLAPASEVLKRPPGALNAPEIGEKLDALLHHLKQNRDRVEIDKRTGELVFDGKLVPGSDARQLFGDVVSPKEKSIKPRGWEELRNVLQYTHAPEHIFGRDWDEVRKRVELEKREREEEEFERNRPNTRDAAKSLKSSTKTASKKGVKRKFKAVEWQSL